MTHTQVPSPSERRAPLEAVIRTADLKLRGSRPADYEAENRAMASLMQAMTDPAGNVLQELVETLLELCGADSAGISVLEDDGGQMVFRWRAIAGRWSPFLGGTMPRDMSPCGTVLDRNSALLLSRPERHYAIPPEVVPPAVEVLLVPFEVDGAPVGTVWVIAHDAGRRFDEEDRRLMTSLSRFASAACRLLDSHLREAALAASQQSALRESERRFREMIDALPAAIYTTDAQGRVTHFNPAAVELSGRVPELGTDRWCVSWKLFSPDGAPLPHDECPMAVALREGSIVRGAEIIAERPDGGRAWLNPYPTPVFDSEGNVVGGINMLVDITERKQSEDALRESERRLRFVMDSMPQKIFTARPNGDVDYFNPQWTEFTGLPFDTIRDWGWTQFIHPDDVTENIRLWRQSIDTGEPFQFEHRFRRVDGEYRWHISRAYPLRDETGQITLWIGSNTEIDDLKLAQDALKQADRRKDEFLATLAHELRNPLAPIRTALRILEKQGSDEDVLTRNREIIDRQVSNMSRLLDDLLDVSRITRGIVRLNKAPLDFREVLQTTVDECRPYIEQRSHQLTLSLPAEPLLVEADRLRLGQVVVNLLTNAAKYTDSGGKIEVGLFQDGSRAVLRVTDNGKGIDAALLPHVFDLFTQGESALDRSQGGVGIGLTLVKNLVTLHGGSVEAKSDGPDRGAEFVVQLPALQNDYLPSSLIDHPASPVHQPPTINHQPSKRVVVVDDNRDGAETVAELVELWGHEARVAFDGVSALKLVREYRPDAVLLDIGMPGKTGYEVARAIRVEFGIDQPLLVAVTGYAREEDRKEAFEAGFDHHLTKPVEPDEVEKLLGGVFETRNCPSINDK